MRNDLSCICFLAQVSIVSDLFFWAQLFSCTQVLCSFPSDGVCLPVQLCSQGVSATFAGPWAAFDCKIIALQDAWTPGILSHGISTAS